MQRGEKAIRRISGISALPQDALPGIPVVEVAGRHRVLIEGHQGVTEYGTQRIQVQMAYGCLVILGCELALAHISKERLVITGTISQLCLG